MVGIDGLRIGLHGGIVENLLVVEARKWRNREKSHWPLTYRKQKNQKQAQPTSKRLVRLIQQTPMGACEIRHNFVFN